MTNQGSNRMSRRAVLGATATASAIGALAGLGGRAGAKQSFSIDADTLIEGNDTFTIALEGTAATSEPTVSVGGVAFASVETIDGSPPLLAIEVSNLLDKERIRSQNSVTVEVAVKADGERVSAEDEVRVVTGR